MTVAALVTEGAGLIGRHPCEVLLAADIRVLSRRVPGTTGFRNLIGFEPRTALSRIIEQIDNHLRTAI